LPGGEIVRWLTVDDPERGNIALGTAGSAAGFVVGNQGFILTGKQAAAGWTLPYGDMGEGENFRHVGIIYDFNKGRKQKGELVALDSLKMTQLKEWVPESGGLVFEAVAPTLIGGRAGDARSADRRPFLGKHDLLEVRFPGSRIGAQAAVVRTAIDADAALIKIESAQTLSPVELAPEADDDSVEVGDKVIVLTYFRDSENRLPVIPFGFQRANVTPEPVVLEGIVSVKGPEVKRKRELTGVGINGDAYQLSLNAAGANGGGPVFNRKGQVIGVFAAPPDQKGVVFAVPIKYGRMLLKETGAN
jgi:hypothetical protein